MFRGTDSILLNIPPFGMNVRNVLQNIVSPTEHCYGHEYCYVGTQEKEVFLKKNHLGRAYVTRGEIKNKCSYGV